MSNEQQKQMTPVDAALEWAESNGPSKQALDLIFDYPRHDSHGRFAPQETSLRILADEVRSLRDENTKLREQTQWRDIASVPRNGTYILIFYQSRMLIILACWHKGIFGDGWYTIGDECCFVDGINPTHWMPMPPAPGKEGAA